MDFLADKLSNIDHEEVFKKNPLPILIFRIDNLQIVSTNPAAEDIYGYNKTEFTSKKISDLLPVHEAELFLGIFKKDPFNIPRQGTWRTINKNEEVLHASFHCFEVLNSTTNNAILNIIFVHDYEFCMPSKESQHKLGIFQYIEKNTPSAEELCWLNTFYNYVIANLDKNISIEDLSFHLSQSIRTLNRHCKAITGLTPYQLVQKIKLSRAHILWDKRLVKNKKKLAEKIGYEDSYYVLQKINDFDPG